MENSQGITVTPYEISPNGPVIRLRSNATGTTLQCTLDEWREFTRLVAEGVYDDIGTDE